jgi:DNA-binding NarL/FixJ family response regulator
MDGSVLRVVLVDDHPVARRGLVRILESVDDIEVVGDYSAPAELSAVLDETRPDVVILDLYFGDEVRSLREIATLSAERAVLVVSASGRPDDVLAAIQAGASGYLTKQASESSYAEAVRAVAAGEFHLSPQLADIVQASFAAQPKGPALSPREQQTLAYIARGFTHSQAATRMRVSKATVDTYVARIRAKLQLGNKAELALAALSHVEPKYRRIGAPEPDGHETGTQSSK